MTAALVSRFQNLYGAVSPAIGPALMVKTARGELPRLIEQVEGLSRRLVQVRAVAESANTKGKCGVLRLFLAVRMVEQEMDALFGTLTSRLFVYTGPHWYVAELARLEAALALELGIWLARSAGNDEAWNREEECRKVDTGEFRFDDVALEKNVTKRMQKIVQDLKGLNKFVPLKVERQSPLVVHAPQEAT